MCEVCEQCDDDPLLLPGNRQLVFIRKSVAELVKVGDQSEIGALINRSLFRLHPRSSPEWQFSCYSQPEQ
jgi:hypothetical protein